MILIIVLVLVILLLLLMHAWRAFSLAPKDFDEDNELPILCENTLLSIRQAHSAAKSLKPMVRILHVEAIILPRHQTYANTPHDLISLRKHACIISRAETMQTQVTISTPTLTQDHHHDHVHGHHNHHVWKYRPHSASKCTLAKAPEKNAKECVKTLSFGISLQKS